METVDNSIEETELGRFRKQLPQHIQDYLSMCDCRKAKMPTETTEDRQRKMVIHYDISKSSRSSLDLQLYAQHKDFTRWLVDTPFRGERFVIASKWEPGFENDCGVEWIYVGGERKCLSDRYGGCISMCMSLSTVEDRDAFILEANRDIIAAADAFLAQYKKTICSGDVESFE